MVRARTVAVASRKSEPIIQMVERKSSPSIVDLPKKAGELPSIRQVLCEGSDSSRPVSELGFAAPGGQVGHAPEGGEGVALHLDHGNEPATCISAIEIGRAHV